MNVGNYKIIEQVGEGGGMGTVYVAMHPVLDTRAIKKLHSYLATNEVILKKFENEARSLNKLKHPNIVEVYDFFEEDGDYYIVMEYVKGDSLAEYLRGGRPLPVKLALDYFLKILDAVGYAHDQRIIHRDIKPSNILISSDSGPKVVDFGIARILSENQDRSTTTSVIGSPAYMAPEQFQGRADARTDVYALGITLFEMLTGRVPFNDKTPYKVARMHEEDPVPSVRTFDQRLSPALDEIIGKATEKIPANRYQTAIEFKHDVIRFLRGPSSFLGKQESDSTSPQDIEAPDIRFTGMLSSEDSPTEDSPGPFFKEDTTIIDKTEDLDIKLPGATEVLENLDSDRGGKDARGTMTELMSGGFGPPADPPAADTQRTEFIPDETVRPQREDPTREISYDMHRPASGSFWQGIATDDKIKLFGLLGIVAIFFVVILWWIFSGPGVQEIAVAPQQVTFHSAQLTWPEVDGTSYYTISRRQSADADFVEVDRVTSNSFVDESLTPSQEYVVRIEALDASREIIGTGKTRVETPPLDIQFSYSRDGRDLVFNWRNPPGKQVALATVNDAGEYEYLFRDSGENYRWRRGASTGDGTTIYALLATPANPEYLADNFVLNVPQPGAIANNNSSGTVKPDPVPPPPAPVVLNPPSNFAAERSGGAVIMSWIPSDKSHQVEIRRRISGRGNFSTLTRLEGNSTGYRDSDVSDDTGYDYAVRTVYEGRRSGATRIISVPSLRPNPPPAPQGLALQLQDEEGIRLSWRPLASNSAQIMIQRRRGDDDSWQDVHTVSDGSTAWIDNAVTAGATYQYRLFSSDNNLNSAPGRLEEIAVPEIAVPEVEEPVEIPNPNPPIPSITDNPAKLQQGREALQQGQLARASQLLGDISRPASYADQKKYYAPAQKLLGIISSQSGQPERAITYFREALAIDAYVADTHYYLAQSLFEQQQYNDAITHYEKVNEYKKTLASEENRRILMESEYQIMRSTYLLWNQSIGEDDRNRFANDFLRRANAFVQRYQNKMNDARYGSQEDMQTKFDNIAIYRRNVQN